MDATHLQMIIAAIGLPIITFWLLIKYFAPSFAARLAASAQDGGTRRASAKDRKAGRNSFSEFLAKLVCKSSTEKAAFAMTWKITGRDKSFRLQFYPSLGYILVLLFIIVFNFRSGVTVHWNHLHNSNSFLWFIYIPLLTVASSIIIITYNENYQASWVFFSTPVNKPGEILSGTLKALFLKYFTLVYAFLFTFCLFIWGPSIIDDFVFGYFNNFLLFIVYALVSNHYFPFSRQPGIKQQSGRWLTAILQLIFIAVMVGIHFIAIRYNDWLIYALMIPILIGCFFSLRSIQNLAWSKISV
jgi:ABC-2 type transport system permease protein